MQKPRSSLAYKLFGAIGLTALAVVGVMAVLIAGSMRDGFTRYLLREELAMLEPVAADLGTRYDVDRPGWPEFRDDARAWRAYLGSFAPEPPGFAKPPRPGPPEHDGADPDAPPDRHADRPPPPDGDAPRPDGKGKPLRRPPAFGDRILLLDAAGHPLIGRRIEGDVMETLPIVAPDAADGASPLGWVGLVAPGTIPKETDAFYLRSQMRALAMAALIALALSGVGAVLLARGFLVPIRALERGAKRLAGGDYAARIPNTRTDELGQLIEHTNVLARTLEEAELAQRAWVSDTSHELQTPLAVLRANIEAIEDGVRPADARTLGAMAEAVERMSRLVHDLRLLSAWHEAALRPEGRVTDLAAILRAAAVGVEDRFAAAGLVLDRDGAEPLPVRGDPQQLRQVLDNLLENALRYTDRPGRVRLSAWRDGGEARVAVDDTPPAPPAASMAHLFDRFHRGETSRSRAHGGSGLGLAICKAIVEAHGGRIAAELSELGGLRVVMSLPVGAGPGEKRGDRT
ncbi:MAG: HAMP domain-containing protein [Maritimibacter sp.]|nr:HAMP domain-containing protein [Maritimibacter sp.]